MANKKISELTGSSALSGTETVPVVQSGSTKKATIGNLQTAVNDSKFHGPDVKIWSSSNVRNGDSASIQIPNTSTVVTFFDHYFLGSEDGSTCTIFASISNDKGKTRGTPFAVLTEVSAQQFIAPMPFISLDGTKLVLLYHHLNGSSFTIKQIETTDLTGFASWSSPVTKITLSAYPAPIGHKILRLSNNTLCLFTSINTNGTLESWGGQYSGRMYVSTNDGSSWSDSGLTINGQNSFAAEIAGEQVGTNIYIFWRNNRGYRIDYAIHTGLSGFSNSNLVDFGGGVKYGPTGLDGVNSSSKFAYDSDSETFYCVHNLGLSEQASGTTDVNDRRALVVSSCFRNISNGWETVMGVDMESDKHFFEPDCIIIDDKLLVTYSDGQSVSGGFKHSVLSRRFPLAALLPRNTERVMSKKLHIKIKKQEWQTGGLQGLEHLMIGNALIADKDGFFKIINHPSLGEEDFIPCFKARGYSNTRGMFFEIDLPEIDEGTETYFSWRIKRGSAGPNASAVVHEWVNDVTDEPLIQILGNGTIYLKALDDGTGIPKPVEVVDGILQIEGGSGGGGGTPEYLTWTESGGMSESPTGNFAASGSTGTAYSTETMAADGSIQMEVTSGTSGVTIGLDAAAGDMNNTSFDFGAQVFGGTIYYHENSGSTTTGTSISTGDLLRLSRVGSTVKIQKSTTGGSSWSDVHTFSTTSSAALYGKLQVNDGQDVTEVQGTDFA